MKGVVHCIKWLDILSRKIIIDTFYNWLSEAAPTVPLHTRALWCKHGALWRQGSFHSLNKMGVMFCQNWLVEDSICCVLWCSISEWLGILDYCTGLIQHSTFYLEWPWFVNSVLLENPENVIGNQLHFIVSPVILPFFSRFDLYWFVLIWFNNKTQFLYQIV